MTGATSGIGRAIAIELAASGYDLVLVARDTARLGEAATDVVGRGVGAVPLVADLSSEADLVRVEEHLTSEDSPIDVLVHCAGGGLPAGGFFGNDVGTSEDMTRLHIDVLMRLAYAAVPPMTSRGRGKVLIISSIAGFAPGSPALTYSAAKAWQTAFGEGLNEYLRGTGCTATVVAPGFVRSEFHARAGASTEGLPDSLWTTPAAVAREAVAGMERGVPLVIPTASWRALYAVFAVLPRRYARRAFARLMGRPAEKRRAVDAGEGEG
ncbi:SDR family NAD(P)-dependent oxidoreductase [Microbacterium esteraromaticum]|uniref:SDR family NAD(P)-dependent oxidoreductase n=1 Tax=Microbacterium esteraromaticum TaxID=57043 RepID=UPI001CD3FEBC|nr:SDR family NAD(P)-dependent oxidoreductase [Microbacterium esteraromaticum]MCA1307847.1 SDR family NAD(P)-dependent oxidoreductase [Microbacterium esteraromaticum]